MKAAFEKIHQSMLAAIKDCREKGLELQAEIESCFTISQYYWSLAEQEIGCDFQSTSEELEFYKIVKPEFLAAIRYYHLLYYAELFKPPERAIIKEFWIKEAQRLDRFISENRLFYTYYKSGSSRLDETYLLETIPETEGQKIHYYDAFISELLALEKYQVYAHHQLTLL